MAKKSIKQDLVLRGLDPNNVVIGADGMFVEREPKTVPTEVEVQPSGIKNALVELQVEEVAVEAPVSVVESVVSPSEIVSEEMQTEEAVVEAVEEKNVAEEAVEAEVVAEPSEVVSTKKNKSKK